MKYQIKVPKTYQTKKEKLLIYFQKFSPLDLLHRFTGRRYRETVIMKHKPLGKAADFTNKTILVDFRNEIDYIFLCVCHELAHLLLRQKPAWHEHPKIKKILKEKKDFKSKKYRYSFQYALEQTLATLLQAACEKEAKIRPMQWSKWQKTFNALEITDFAKILFPQFKLYLQNLEKYKSIDNWLVEVLPKYYKFF